ncbi:LPS assembly lipoprotein LptE [uncultured Enterovirga sp.]|uniref:LPS assembly lipoprotein LptE n=1 Tax=uncultured Enterovirga sp. TaxID=2026352 RepID=UPI0035CBF390
MSWHRYIRPALAAGIALAAAGCLRPLYGPTASGVPLQEALASISVENVTTPLGQERLGHYLRSELIFDLDGSGQVSRKKYRLTLDASESVQVTTTDTVTGRADAALLNVTVKYVLLSNDGSRPIGSGTARTTATYFRDPQRFANVRAARDAEIRASKLIADDIKQRLAALFATSP